jgi:hypothetical protein
MDRGMALGQRTGRGFTLATFLRGKEGTQSMAISDESPQSTPHLRWLDWWCEPPWRALLTWMALAALSGWALNQGSMRLFTLSMGLVFDLESRFALPVPTFVHAIAYCTSAFLLLLWFEPFVLRLNLLHGIAWMGLRLIPFVLTDFWAITHNGDLSVKRAIALFVWSVLAVAVLHRCRSRPWISVIGGALMAVADYILERSGISINKTWVWMPVMTLPYAAILLYGTRPLSAERKVMP